MAATAAAADDDDKPEGSCVTLGGTETISN